ncbi:MAG: flagellar hook-length control protein FliK, partial [Alphaproteobacteria bacterium]
AKAPAVLAALELSVPPQSQTLQQPPANVAPALVPTGATGSAASGDGLEISLPGLRQAAIAADAAARARPASPAYQAPVRQVAVVLQQGLKSGADRFHIRLYPAELGRVDVKLEIAHDKIVHALVTVEKIETLQALERDSHSLQQALEQAGLRADADSLSFRHGRMGGQATSSEGENARPDDGSEIDGNPDELAVEESQPRRRHDGLLDLEV